MAQVERERVCELLCECVKDAHRLSVDVDLASVQPRLDQLEAQAETLRQLLYPIKRHLAGHRQSPPKPFAGVSGESYHRIGFNLIVRTLRQVDAAAQCYRRVAHDWADWSLANKRPPPCRQFYSVRKDWQYDADQLIALIRDESIRAERASFAESRSPKEQQMDLLSTLRNELVSLKGEPWSRIESWIAKATPIIRSDRTSHFDDFQRLVAHVRARVRGAQWMEHNSPGSLVRCANEEQETLISFCDGLLVISETDKVAAAVTSGSTKPTANVDPRKVFVVYGRNSAARDAVFAFLRAIGLHPLEWSEIVKETGEASPYVGNVLEAGFSIVQAVVVLLTPDDEARLRQPYRVADDPEEETELTPQPRPNVLLEAGMALGLFPERTIIVEMGRLRPISDIHGRHVIRLDNSPQKRQALAQRLKTAGCAVNLDGTDWFASGDFDIVLTDCGPVAAEPAASVETEIDVLSGYTLSAEARKLLVTAAASDGQVLYCRSSDGCNTQASDQILNEPHNARSEALWEQAIHDLVSCGLLKERGRKGEFFEVTAKGYDVADALQKRGAA